MKLVPLENISGKRLVFPIRGIDGKRLVFDAHETKYVSPATVKHPAVSIFIGGGLKVVGNETQEKEVPKPKELVPTTLPKESAPVPTSENEPSTDDEQSEPEEPVDTSAGEVSEDLHDLYVSAPGITDSNVNAVLDSFTTVTELADASEHDLLEAGISRSYVKRLRKWARSQ